MRRIPIPALCLCALLWSADHAAAQQTLAGYTVFADTQARIAENHLKLTGGVILEQGDTKIFADEIDLFTGEDRAVASGNVVLSQGANRIAADRADFNVKTRLGSFYNATGIATVKPPRQPPQAGAIAVPQMAGQETDVYFYGETVEKIGVKKYRITNGGFSTCVQPTPRWNLTSKTVVLNIDHYTLLRDAVLNVKGVPMLYLPVMYYPTKKEDRATGFLIPTYGSSTIRGQAIHNAFFWAIGRSEDATFMHDWYSKTGQGVGGEYRYNYGGGSDGNFRAYMLDTNETTYALANGTTSTLPASRSYELRGGANQLLPGKIRARARIDYFSDIATSQTFNTNIYDASRTQRTIGANITGAWGAYSLNGTMDRAEYFYSTTSSTVTGSGPRLAFTRNEKPVFGSDLYFTVTGEYARLIRDSMATGTDATTGLVKPIDIDTGLTRLDISPQIRFPLKKWQWFTVNTSLSWRDTYYTRSLDLHVIDPRTSSAKVVDQGLNRRYYTIQAQVVGPVFNRIWDTPDNGFAEKFKHSIEPVFNVQRTSSIDNFDDIVKLDGADSVVGGTTMLTYGVNNRFYAKQRPLVAGQRSQSREIFAVELSQSYYTDQNAAKYDQQYSTSFSGAPASHFSPIALSVRATPSIDLNATLRAEFDSRYHSLRTIQASSTYSWTGRIQTTAGWSKRAFIKELAGFNDLKSLDHAVNASANLHTKDNRVGGVYSFNWDVLHNAILQQRMSAFYNAQCCGLAFEYQTFNFANFGGSAPVPADHRFFLSFTLAGLGNFSPFNGAMGGVPR